MEEAQARELLGFLRPESRADVRSEAAALVAGLTGGAEGLRLVAARPALVAALLALAGDEDPPAAAAAHHASRALAHLAAEPAAHQALAAGLPGLVRRLLQPAHPLAPLAAAALANLARHDDASCRRLLDALQREGGGLQPLVETLCRPAPPPPPPALAALLANLSRLPEARAFLLHPDRCVLPRLLPYTQYSGSALLRGGVVRVLRNCCFDYERHEWLLSDQVDVLPFLLLPLAGPEEFPEEEMERLPLDLQYLPPEKQREPDPDIRKLLLEAVLLLTATKPGRQAVRQKGAYFIVRELHKWETDPGVLGACEKLIQVLIGDEPEPGMENLLEVEIPAEVEEQLQRLDQEEEQQQQQRTTSGSQAPPE
ncbi:protein HGH1 homolog [Sphaerodactylus townsendi]|uniref:protein HGH1 homolog n=1 Tax=Sphaerodactylus townsendi TaxID=933632 RepID=UPI00202677DB|nr:protein HGH1 homolog [Sphaerodactylus townsendi]